MTTVRAGLLCMISATLAFWAFGFWAFGMNFSALGLIVGAGISLPWGWSKPRIRIGSLGVSAALGLALCWAPVLEYNLRVDALSARLDQGPRGFSTRDKLGIYGLNLAMGFVGGLAGFPEVAVETGLLAVPGPPTRVIHSDFPMASPQVRVAMAKMIRSGQAGSTTLTWRYSADESLRAGLALNSLLLRGRPEGKHWHFTGTVAISCPHRYRLVLGRIAGHPLQVEEGLFAMLEQAQWLHPYDAQYTWTISADDPQLNDLKTPRRAWLEALAVWAMR